MTADGGPLFPLGRGIRGRIESCKNTAIIATDHRLFSEACGRKVRSWRLSGQAVARLGWFWMGPVSDFSEEPVLGCEPVTLDISAVPACPAGSVFARASVFI